MPLQVAACLVALASVLLSGCFGQSGGPQMNEGPTSPPAQAGSIAASAASWNFTGHSGEQRAEVANLSWIHIAVPLGHHPSSVLLRLKFDYGHSSWPIGMHARATWISEDNATGADVLESVGGLTRPTTSQAAVDAQLLGQSLARGQPLDAETHMVTGAVGEIISTLSPGNATLTHSFFYQRTNFEAARGLERPVLHHVFLDLSPARQTKAAIMELEWSDGAPAHSAGGREETFVRFKSDFISDVQLDAQAGVYAAHGGQSATLLFDAQGNDTTVVFFTPRACLGSCAVDAGASGTMTDPAGRQSSGSMLAGVHASPGSWRFEMPAHVAIDENAPVVFGIDGARPVFAWSMGNAAATRP